MAHLGEDSSFGLLKTMLSVLLGLACLLGGWIIYSAEGFYSPTLFLTGTLMMPLGALVLGMGLAGGFGETRWDAGARSQIGELERRERLD
jgi:hypothetical protein